MSNAGEQIQDADLQKFIDSVLEKWWEGKDNETYDGFEVNSLISEAAKIAFEMSKIKTVFFVSAGHSDEYSHFIFSTHEKAKKFVENEKPETYGYRMDAREIQLDTERSV